MKKMIYSFVLVGFMLIGTSVPLFGQDPPFSEPPRVYQGCVIMKAPVNVERAALEFIENDFIVDWGFKLELTGYAVNFGWWKRGALFCVEFRVIGRDEDNNYNYWVWVTADGEAISIDQGWFKFSNYDGGMQFEKP